VIIIIAIIFNITGNILSTKIARKPRKANRSLYFSAGFLIRPFLIRHDFLAGSYMACLRPVIRLCPATIGFFRTPAEHHPEKVQNPLTYLPPIFKL
jgi:hypothetical protein